MVQLVQHSELHDPMFSHEFSLLQSGFFFILFFPSILSLLTKFPFYQNADTAEMLLNFRDHPLMVWCCFFDNKQCCLKDDAEQLHASPYNSCFDPSVELPH